MTTETRETPAARAAALAGVRALASLVERLREPPLALPAGADGPIEQRVRSALRALTAASRTRELRCHVDAHGLHVNELLLPTAELQAELPLLDLARQLALHDVSTLHIRQGAAPGELLTLGRVLAERVRAPAGAARDDAVTLEPLPPEVLRTWSVRLTPASMRAFPPGVVAASVESALGRLRAARTDDGARAAVRALLDLAADAEGAQDASTLESIALALTLHARSIGPGEGRLATEGGLRRLLREGVVLLLATRVPDSNDRDTLIATLSRTGETVGRALVAALMASDDRTARRSYFDAIVAQAAGAAQLQEALGDPRWYVVRNAAALLGEMGVADADAALIPLLAHGDERIRIAAARALTRLHTPHGLAALQQQLLDDNAEVRRLAAAAYGLANAAAGGVKPHSAPLAAALAAESDEDVALEMIASLGKLASADAVQRLIRLCMRNTDRAPHPAWFRVAALEALVAARGHASMGTLEALTTDASEEVAAAARRLLATVHPIAAVSAR